MKPILDNPIWNALTTRDANNNMGSHNFAFFDGDIAPFIGMPFWDKNSQRELFNNVDASRNWFLLIGEKVRFKSLVQKMAGHKHIFINLNLIIINLSNTINLNEDLTFLMT